MLVLALAGLIVGLILLPHVLALEAVSPVTAAAVWLATLIVRAAVSVGAAIFALVYVPQTDLARSLADWCWHEVLPTMTGLLGFSEHPLSHAAVALPVLGLAASLLWLAFGLLRGWLGLRRTLRRAVGRGPLGSTIVSDDEIVVAVPRLGRGRVVVSDRALRAMDSAELRAGLTHELGHINRRHRPVLLFASVLGALARPLPGTSSVERELSFSLERDADEYAVRETSDRLALASAICKAAGAPHSPALTALGQPGSVTLRLRLLVEGAECPSRRRERLARALAVLLAVVAIALTAAVPASALGGNDAWQALVGSDLCHPH